MPRRERTGPREVDRLFRLLAIADSNEICEHVVEVAASFPDLPVGILLRFSPERLNHINETVARIEEKGCRNIRVITHTTPVGDHWVHLPSRILEKTETDDAITNVPNNAFGISIHSLTDVQKVKALSPRYLLAAPVLRTDSKPNAVPLGMVQLQKIVEASSIPVIGLGGIGSVDDVSKVLQCGAYGVAGISLARPEKSESLWKIFQFLDRSEPTRESLEERDV